MAVHLEFTKESESETEVVYRFGPTQDPQAHLVSISKSDPSATTLPGDVSASLTGRVIGRAASLARQTGSWPDRGLIQS